jgi:hypothetical protein
MLLIKVVVLATCLASAKPAQDGCAEHHGPDCLPSSSFKLISYRLELCHHHQPAHHLRSEHAALLATRGSEFRGLTEPCTADHHHLLCVAYCLEFYMGAHALLHFRHLPHPLAVI